MAKRAPAETDSGEGVITLPTRRDALRMGGAALVMAPRGVELVRDAFPRRPGLEDRLRQRPNIDNPRLGVNDGVDRAVWTDSIFVVDKPPERVPRFGFLRPKSTPLPEVHAAFIAANAAGAFESYWYSSFMAMANGNEELHFDLRAVPFNSTYANPSSVRPFSLNPGTSLSFDNVIVDALNLTRFAGTVYVDVKQGQGAFESRVINRLPDGTLKGQRSAPLLQANAINPGQEGFIFTEIPSAGRVNPYFLAWEDANFLLSAQAPDGRTIASYEHFLRAGEAIQFVDVYNNIPDRKGNIGKLAMDSHEEPLGIVVETSGRLSGGGSSIDNESGDTTWSEASREPILIGETVAVKNTGSNNSAWRRSVSLWNQDPDNHKFFADFFFDDGTHIPRHEFPMPSRGGVRLNDVLDEMGVLNAYGTLMLTSACAEGSHMGGTIYTLGDEGRLGQSMPVFERLNAIHWETVGRLFGLSNIEKRVNLNIMNSTDPQPGWDSSVVYRATVMDGDTRHVYREWEGTLDGKEMTQINRILEKSGYHGSNALIEVDWIGGNGGRLQASTSTIENSSNDPTHQQHTLGPHYVEPEFDTEVYIHVMDNGMPYEATTHPSPEIVKRVFQIGTLEARVGVDEFVCGESTPGGAVDTLGEVIHNYNGLSAAEQQEFSGDRIGFSPFANDSDFDGSPCDADEPDHQYVNLIRLTVTPR